MLRLVLLSVLLATCLGCEKQAPPNVNFKNEANRATNLVMSPKTNHVALSADSQIKIAVYQHLINELSSAGSRHLYFLPVTTNEMQALQSFAPYCVLKFGSCAEYYKPDKQFRDKETGELGTVIEIQEVEIRGKQANVKAGYFSGSGVIFDYSLTNNANWVVTKKSTSIFID